MAAASLAVVPAPRKTLYDLVDDAQTIIQTLESLDECDDAARDELTAMLVAAIAGTKTKVDNTAAVLAAFASAEAAAGVEITRLKTRAAYFARQTARLESHVLAVLATSELAALDGYTNKLSARKNPPAVAIDDEMLIPWEFLRLPPEVEPPPPAPDKAAIKKAILAGQDVAGCRLEVKTRLVRS